MDITNDLKEQLIEYYHGAIKVLPRLVLAILLAVIFFIVLRFVRKKLIKLINMKADDRLLVNFFDSILHIINIILTFLIFLYLVGQAGIASSILGAATISSVVIGFAFKDIAENFLAGVIMAFNRPFRIGDIIKTTDVEGKITGLSLRDTHIKTFDGKDVYVPNGQIIKNPLYNYTIDGFLRKSFVIGLDYGTDIDAARRMISDTLMHIPGILKEDKMPLTLIKEFGASTINIDVQFWLDTFDKKHSATEIRSQAMKQVLNKLEAEGINLPGDVVELKNYKDTPIQTGNNVIA